MGKQDKDPKWLKEGRRDKETFDKKTKKGKDPVKVVKDINKKNTEKKDGGSK